MSRSGNSASLHFNSCRQTTSGFATFSHASRLGRRRLMLLMLKVAIFMRSLKHDPEKWTPVFRTDHAQSRLPVFPARKSFSQPNTERPSYLTESPRSRVTKASNDG